jgi:sterol desaturase/sphingolipid hydroxylase (fatty acid hydroxylase superfamily)
MNSTFFTQLLEHYQWQLSLFTFLSILSVSFVGGYVLKFIPTIKAADQLNKETFRKKSEQPHYAANQKGNRKWSLAFTAVIFGLIIPFCLTLQLDHWWRVPLDVVIILMFYDFFYYIMHRFLFHNGGVAGGPLMPVHAVHHRQHNPCRMDSSYIHPLEVAMGLGLYVASIFVLSRFMGNFHVVTIIITWVAFTQINLHNHDLWTVDRFPFRYLNYISKMHHHHHTKFTGGNFATITPLYDWMFGTLDNGDGNKGAKVSSPKQA